jgi:hypothetical protein
MYTSFNTKRMRYTPVALFLVQSPRYLLCRRLVGHVDATTQRKSSTFTRNRTTVIQSIATYYREQLRLWANGVQLIIQSCFDILMTLCYTHTSVYTFTVTARSKAWTVFARSNTEIVGSNLTREMDVCMSLFCLCAVLCAGSGLATGWSPVRGVLPTVYRIKKLKSSQGPTKGCRAVDRYVMISMV